MFCPTCFVPCACTSCMLRRYSLMSEVRVTQSPDSSYKQLLLEPVAARLCIVSSCKCMHRLARSLACSRKRSQCICNRQHWHGRYLLVQGPANVDAIGLLVELGANLWSVMKDADMETPLHMASRSGRLDIVEKLLRCGADFSKKTKVSWLGNCQTVALHGS